MWAVIIVTWLVLIGVPVWIFSRLKRLEKRILEHQAQEEERLRKIREWRESIRKAEERARAKH